MAKEIVDPFDIVKIALEVDLLRVPFYVERWKSWITIEELSGTQHGEYMGQCIDKERNINFKKLNVLMAVTASRFPDSEFPPDKDHPHYAEFPGLQDESGNFITSPHPKAGQVMFNLSQMGPLNKRSGAALAAIGKRAGEISGLTPEDLEKKKKKSDQEPEDWEIVDSTTE
jgi:hypothetical protein